LVVDARSCTIPISTFRAAPFLLDWGNIVYAKLSATNIKGTSAFSEIGFGGIIETTPDTPINLSNNILVTNS